jgi:hypothetical protein
LEEDLAEEQADKEKLKFPVYIKIRLTRGGNEQLSEALIELLVYLII